MSSTEKNSKNILPSRSFLFISDVHLGAFSAQKNRELELEIIKLVDFCREHRLEIVILGDFFDYWMEYPGNRVPPVGRMVLQHFCDYHVKTGSHSLFVTGNHDNWTNGHLADLGFDVEHEYRILTDSATRILVLHGDGLKDPAMNLPRPAMHRLLRNSYFIKMYQTFLPPRLGWIGMRLFSGSSRKTGEKKRKSSRADMLDLWAKNRVRTNDEIQAIVYGHHHRQLLWSENGLTCLNCGFFGGKKTLGLYANKAFQIVTWNGSEMTLETRNMTVDRRE